MPASSTLTDDPPDISVVVVSYNTAHLLDRLFAALDALDKMSLAAQRKLTIPFVKAVLQM